MTRLRFSFVALALLLPFGTKQGFGQHIQEVLEYRPAPGQLVNQAAYGSPWAARRLATNGNALISLGAFGGYVVFRFDELVLNDENNPYGIDFTLFGNAFPQWSEAGAVYVMPDDNQNLLPDEHWYLLAGSDFHFESSKQQWRVSYQNPNQPQAADVAWQDQEGNQGFIFAQQAHGQPYYPLADSFPEIDQEEYELAGAWIAARVEQDNPAWISSPPRRFGYADNRTRGDAAVELPDNPYTFEKEGYGGDAFDLAWAVDNTGQPVELQSALFVKVQTAVLGNANWLGELSTELAGAKRTTPAPGTVGEDRCVVLNGNPRVLALGEHQMEAVAFRGGRPSPEPLVWSVVSGSASIDSEGRLDVRQAGPIELEVAWQDAPEIADRQTFLAQAPAAVGTLRAERGFLYPNPNRGAAWLWANSPSELLIFDLSGRMVWHGTVEAGEQWLEFGGLAPGLYGATLRGREGVQNLKMLILP